MSVRSVNVDCDTLPDACGNELRQEKLIKVQDRHDDRTYWRRAFDRDKHFLLACAILVALLNVDTGRYVLYPFQIFATWIHEMCHGMAAVISGGSIVKLQIFKDGSGLAYTVSKRRGFVASAGYPGTSVTGFIMLLYRRTTLGPTIGTIGLGLALVLSCCLLVRNMFGGIVLTIEGVALVACGWFLPAKFLDHLFSFLAATCCLNAVESIHDLFAADQGYVNGEVMSTDAHTVAEYWGGNYHVWGWLWFCTSLILFIIGVVAARDAKELPWKQQKSADNDTTIPIVTAIAIPEETAKNGYAKPPPFATWTGV